MNRFILYLILISGLYSINSIYFENSSGVDACQLGGISESDCLEYGGNWNNEQCSTNNQESLL